MKEGFKVAAIIPAYNEENTLKEILKTLKRVKKIHQIMVISDGSEDNTAEVAHECGVEVIDLLDNRGKGGAIKAGIQHTDAEILVLLDGDLIGLTPRHVQQLIDPVLLNEVEMSIGIFQQGRMATDLAQKMAPFLSGQRALRRKLIDNISQLELSRFGVEVALHTYTEEHHIPYREVKLPDLSHVMKEEKLGVAKGIAARIKMYWDILKYVLRFNQSPK